MTSLQLVRTTKGRYFTHLYYLCVLSKAVLVHIVLMLVIRQISHFQVCPHIKSFFLFYISQEKNNNLANIDYTNVTKMVVHTMENWAKNGKILPICPCPNVQLSIFTSEHWSAKYCMKRCHKVCRIQMNVHSISWWKNTIYFWVPTIKNAQDI